MKKMLQIIALAGGLVGLAGCCGTHKTAASSTSTSVGTKGAAAAPAQTTNDALLAAAAKGSAPFEGEGWQSMFDGRTLMGWRETQFAGHGELECKSGMIVLNMGDPFTGINWTNPMPKMDYEIALDAMRVMGSDFFCGLTVPVGESCCSLIVGGWGGSLVGISSLDGMDAAENETTKFINFETGRWYRLRLRVTEKKLTVWIDQDRLIDVEITDKKISVRPGDIEMSQPCGIAAWQTTAAFRQINFRRLD